jgi:hypothetical protein
MNIVCIIIFINFLLTNTLHLNLIQIKKINNLIQNPSTTIKQREIINNILYKAYEKWSIKQAFEFKNKHYIKTKNINTDELILSSKIGLYKATVKYNGKISFTYYSSIYIKHELLKTVTDAHSLSILPSSIRKTNKKKFTNEQLINYNNLVNVKLISYENNWMFDKYYNTLSSDNTNLYNIIEHDKLLDLWQELNKSLSPFSKRIIHLKYDFNFNVIHSNKDISNLMCCSEETIRKTINKSLCIITEKVNIL